MRTNKIISACLALCLVGSAVPFVDVGEFPVIVANAVEQTITMSQKASWSVTYTGNCGENIVWSFNPETGEFIISGTGKF